MNSVFFYRLIVNFSKRYLDDEYNLLILIYKNKWFKLILTFPKAKQYIKLFLHLQRRWFLAYKLPSIISDRCGFLLPKYNHT